MNRLHERQAEQLPWPLQASIWLFNVFFLSVFAFTLPGWFLLTLALAIILLMEYSRDWGNDG